MSKVRRPENDSFYRLQTTTLILGKLTNTLTQDLNFEPIISGAKKVLPIVQPEEKVDREEVAALLVEDQHKKAAKPHKHRRRNKSHKHSEHRHHHHHQEEQERGAGKHRK